MPSDKNGDNLRDVPIPDSATWASCLTRIRDICHQNKIGRAVILADLAKNYTLSYSHLEKILKGVRAPSNWHNLVRAIAECFARIDARPINDRTKFNSYLSRIYGINPSEILLVALNFLQYSRQEGIDFNEITRITTSIDEQTIPSISAAAAGSIEQWVPIQELLNECGSFIVDRNNCRVAGYFFLMPILDEVYNKIRDGSLDNSSLTKNDVPVEFGIPGKYSAFLIDLAILPQYRGRNALSVLSNSILETILGFAETDVFFKRICAHAYTFEGEKLCEIFNMAQTGLQQNYTRLKPDGTHEPVPVYELALLPFDQDKAVYKRLPSLRRAYANIE